MLREKKKTDAVEALLKEVLTTHNLTTNLLTLEQLITLGTEHRVPQALRVAQEALGKRAQEAARSIEASPLGLEGAYLTIPEMAELNWGYTLPEIVEKIKGHPDDFAQQMKEGETLTYYVSGKNAGFLDKTGQKAPHWQRSALEFRLVATLRGMATQALRTLEREQEAERSVPALHPEPSTSSHPGIRLTAAELVALGSKVKTVGYLALKIGRLGEQVGAERVGGAWTALLTPENYRLFGFKAFPTTLPSPAKPLLPDASQKSPTFPLVEVRKEPNILYETPGIWMNTKEIQARGSAYGYASIIHHMKKPSFHPTKIGTELFAWITPHNFADLKLSYFPGVPTEAFHSGTETKEEGTERTSKLRRLDRKPGPVYLKDLARLMHVPVPSLKKKVEAQEALFPPEQFYRELKQGKPYVVELTHENARALGLELIVEETATLPLASSPPSPETPQPSVQLPQPAQRQLSASEPIQPEHFTIGRTPYKYSPAGVYPTQALEEVLQKISSIFGPHTIKEVWAGLGATEGTIKGSEWIPFLRLVEDMLPLNVTRAQKAIGDALHIPHHQVDAELAKPIYADLRYVLPGTTHTFVKRSQLQELQLAAQAHTRTSLPGTTPPNTNGTWDPYAYAAHAEERLREHRLLPPGEGAAFLLRKAGVFKLTSEAEARASYARFEQATMGYEALNLSHFQQKSGLPWATFREKYLPVFIGAETVKDLVTACEGDPKFCFTVVRRGQREHVLRALEAVVKPA